MLNVGITMGSYGRASRGTIVPGDVSGSHHIFPYQWDQSRHGNPLYAARGASTSCAPCHSGSGFVAWLKGGKSLTEAPPVTAITCATCHDPHSVKNEHQVRLLDPVQLGNGVVINEGGTGLLCMNCHKSRRNSAEYTGPDFSYSSHFGPHHGPQADILAGTNFPTFGKMIPSFPHLAGVENACVTCHMAETHETDPKKMAGAHSFRMVSQDGTHHVEACVECHGEVGETFAEKKYYVNGSADHDGDGVEEGLQEEVHGLLEELAMMLPPVDTAEVDMGGDYVYTVTEVKAAYNWFAVEEDRSLGVHNPAFVVGLMKTSIQAVKNHALEGDIVAIEDIPNDQGKQVRIIWDKMADDGIAVDPVATYIVKRNDGDETWTNVGEATADGSPRYALPVATVWDSTAMGPGLTEFKVVAVTRNGQVSESMPASGYSVDNLVPHAPPGLMANAYLGDVELTWESAPDPDVNYYKVFRSDNAGFTPDEANAIGTTAEMVFVDAQPGIGSWYYKVVAVDFSGNIGEPTSVVNATLTSVDGSTALPTKFDLSQNYPNPFNPETSIRFSVKNSGHVTLEIYNSRGQRVNTVVDKDMSAGEYNINFLADGLTSGVYIYKIKVNASAGESFQAMKKMILMK